MRTSICVAAACFYAATLLGAAQPSPELQREVWLETGGHWTRTDRYGLDKNKNGTIDREEWRVVRTQGDDRTASPLVETRPLRPGEVHRWNVVGDEAEQTTTSGRKVTAP